MFTSKRFFESEKVLKRESRVADLAPGTMYLRRSTYVLVDEAST